MPRFVVAKPHAKLSTGEVIGKRAEQLAKAFGVHPAIVMFPEYESAKIQKTA
jgi:hypothetical protein